jgi:hypothetical protein
MVRVPDHDPRRRPARISSATLPSAASIPASSSPATSRSSRIWPAGRTSASTLEITDKVMNDCLWIGLHPALSNAHPAQRRLHQRVLRGVRLSVDLTQFDVSNYASFICSMSPIWLTTHSRQHATVPAHSPIKLWSYYFLYLMAKQSLNVDGDFFECGVFKGGSASFIAQLMDGVWQDTTPLRHV